MTPTENSTSSDGIFRNERTSRADSVHGIVQPSAGISNRHRVSFPDVSSGISTHAPTQYMSGSKAIASSVIMDTGHTHSSDSSVPPIVSRRHRRTQPRRAPLQSTAPLNPPPQDSPHATHRVFPGTLAYVLTDPPAHPTSVPQDTRRRATVGHQHTLTDVYPHLHAVHSPPFAFPRHMGSPMQEENMRHFAYVSPSVMTPLPPHASVYQYRTPPDLIPTPPRFPPPMVSALSSPTYPHTRGPSGSAYHSTPYVMRGAYTPMGYAAHPSYVYPPPASFIPAPYVYGSHRPHPPPHRPYDLPSGQESQGTWWHSFPGATVAASSFEETQRDYQLADSYPPAGQLDGEQPDQLNAVSLPSEPQPTQTRIRPGRLLDTAKKVVTRAPSPTSPTSSRTKHQERRSYHPKPPADRSEWVMWAGNVPSNVMRDELREFFNQPPLSPTPSQPADAGKQVHGGVSTVFIISRSNCAFVNFESEAQLKAAMARFNGQSIRPEDRRCQRLVCRVRRREDHLMAGVGGQRGSSMHTKWVKEQKARDDSGWIGEVDASAQSNPTRSASNASTNSDILTRSFPQRFFILKSWTQYDLNLSVRKNIWTTQHHNEEILDQAYRTSKDVFLIFSVNKSGEFYGYARMAGQVIRDETGIPWASAELTPPHSSVSSIIEISASATPLPDGAGAEELQDQSYIFTLDEHRVEQSPHFAPASWPSFASAERHRPDDRLTNSMPNTHSTRPPYLIQASHSLKNNAPTRGTWGESAELDAVSVSILAGGHEDDTLPKAVPEGRDTRDDGMGSAWDLPFRIQWIRTDSLPFVRTRHLRNPWNHGREVKISRDGTELEPAIGQLLLDEWEKASSVALDDKSAGPSRTQERRRKRKSTK